MVTQKFGISGTGERWRGTGSTRQAGFHNEAQVLLLRFGARGRISHVQDSPSRRTCLRGMLHKDDKPEKGEGRGEEAMTIRFKPRRKPV